VGSGCHRIEGHWNARPIAYATRVSRNTIALSLAVALALSGAAIACDSDSTGDGSGVAPTPPAITIDGGTPPEGGSGPGPAPNPGTLNQILGLTSKGSIIRIGLGANGVDEDLGFPKFNGAELRNIGAIAAGGGGLYGIDFGARSGSNIVKINLPGLDCVPMGADIDLRAQEPDKEGLAFSGNTLYVSDQFSPVVALDLDGTMRFHSVRQQNTATDDTQCYSPEDLLWEGALLGAGSCASATQPEKNGYFVWEYILGQPSNPGGGGGTSTDKSLKWKSPERILGLGKAAGIVAVSAQRHLLSLTGDSFVVVRELSENVVDLE
jgi:hypothetical protein